MGGAQGRGETMRRFLVRTDRAGATTGAKKEILRRLQGEKGRRVRVSGSRLLSLRLVRSKLSAVIVGVRFVALCDIAEGNCAFHIFACEDRLVFPSHEDLDIRG